LVAGLLIAAGLGVRLIGMVHGWSTLTLDVMTPSAFETLGAGAWLAGWMESREDLPERLGSYMNVALAAGLALYACPPLFTELRRALLLTWLVAQAVWGIPGWIGQALESVPARALGRWSYAIYLSHNYFFAMFKARPHHLAGLSVYDSQAVMAFAATLAWSMACYHLLEKPLARPQPQWSVRAIISS
jgi:peptidoglycan/LPS O-acetylase OafA/YrhL